MPNFEKLEAMLPEVDRAHREFLSVVNSIHEVTVAEAERLRKAQDALNEVLAPAIPAIAEGLDEGITTEMLEDVFGPQRGDGIYFGQRLSPPRFLRGVVKFHTIDAHWQELLYRVEEAGNELPAEDPRRYVIRLIRSQDEDLFWSNEHGWGDRSEADLYSANERVVLNSPMGGVWMEAGDAPAPETEMKP